MSTTLSAHATIELDIEVSNLKQDFITKYFDRDNMYHEREFDESDIEELLDMKETFEEDYMKKAIDILVDGICKYGKIQISIY